MKDEHSVDLGQVQIHKKAIADIAFSAMNQVEGVSVLPKDIGNRFLEFLGQKAYSGIRVGIDKDHQVTIKLEIYVKYGINIPEAAKQVQDVVRSAVEQIADLTLKEIHVNVQGIDMERGKI